MNVEDPQVLKDLVDQAARNFGGILTLNWIWPSSA